MNIEDFIGKAKRILKEDAGSEGMVYKLTTKNSVTAIKNDILTIDDVHKDNGNTVCRITFTYPRDYGFAMNTLKAHLGDIDVARLELLY